VSSYDGSRLVATSVTDLDVSADSGVTWTKRMGQKTAGAEWWAVSSSADGSKLAAVEDSGYIFISVDAGTTWNMQGMKLPWRGIASSADGTSLVAVAAGDYIYTSSGPVP
jgi:photosystem II stability/assembly factor-like uncharacterized protein